MSGPSWRSTWLDLAAPCCSCSRSRFPIFGISRSIMYFFIASSSGRFSAFAVVSRQNLSVATTGRAPGEWLTTEDGQLTTLLETSGKIQLPQDGGFAIIDRLLSHSEG